jgi:multiple sugar transport system substrate-binding protein
MPYGADVMTESSVKGKYHNGFNNEAGFKALKLFIDLIYKYKVTDFNIAQDTAAFAQGKASMLEREQALVGFMKTNAPSVNYGAAPLPRGVRRATFVAPRALFVTKAGKNQDSAWKFLKYFYQISNQEVFVKDSGWLSTRRDLNYDAILKDSPQLLASVKYPPDLQLLPYPSTIETNEIYSRFGERISQVLLDGSLLDNDAKIRAEVDKLGNMVDDILKEAGKYSK